MLITAERYHDFSCGHRVVGHEGKCAALHGHNYRVTFTIAAPIDAIGRVLDFSVIKGRLCEWLEQNWDHKFLAWDIDPLLITMEHACADSDDYEETFSMLGASLVWLPFNPTAEGMADYLLRTVGPAQLAGTDAQLIMVRVEETRKCSATATL